MFWPIFSVGKKFHQYLEIPFKRTKANTHPSQFRDINQTSDKFINLMNKRSQLVSRLKLNLLFIQTSSKIPKHQNLEYPISVQFLDRESPPVSKRTIHPSCLKTSMLSSCCLASYDMATSHQRVLGPRETLQCEAPSVIRCYKLV